jgi:hypothetical protein
MTNAINANKGELVDDDLLRRMVKCTYECFKVITPVLPTIPQEEGETEVAIGCFALN